MLRIIQNSTPAGAKSYYSTADYYVKGQELAGVWRGHAAGWPHCPHGATTPPGSGTLLRGAAL